MCHNLCIQEGSIKYQHQVLSAYIDQMVFFLSTIYHDNGYRRICLTAHICGAVATAGDAQILRAPVSAVVFLFQLCVLQSYDIVC